MQPISLKTLLEAGCHFGHKTERWHPKAKQFIYQARDGIHIIDLAKTKEGLESAAQYLYEVGQQGGDVVFVGTKRQAHAVVEEITVKNNIPHLVHRWIGGFLTNWEQIHANLEKIRKMEEDQTAGNWKQFPKHEQVKLAHYLARLKVTYGGVLTLYEKPAAVFITDIRKDALAVREANRQGIKVIAIVDTNCDPSLVDFPIPANDDAVGSIKCITQYLADAYVEGREVGKKQKEKEMKEEEAKKAKEAQSQPKVDRLLDEKVAKPATKEKVEKPKNNKIKK